MGRWGDGERGRWGDGEIFIKGNYPDMISNQSIHIVWIIHEKYCFHKKLVF
ncbi:MAG: hypothetical protein F6K50_48405 [Moorea sp. SIO3I7]|nr:hypothetical protein [Moorena sp. SIO3I7]